MSIVMWHGGRQWHSPPVIPPSRPKGSELGPGIYVSNFYETGARFAKGGGSVREIVLSPNLILEHTSLSLSDACDFVTSVVVKSKQGKTIDKMIECAGRHHHEGRILLGTDSQQLHAESLIALCVNGDLTLGSKGQALAEFLTSQGIDCSFSRRSGNEFWGTIYNPECIESSEKMPASKMDPSRSELPDPFAQLDAQRKKASRILLPDDASPAL